MSWQLSPSIFPEQFVRERDYVFLKASQHSTTKPCETKFWSLLKGRVLDSQTQFFSSDSSIQVLYFFLGLSWHLIVFQKHIHLSQVFKCLGIQLLIIFYYCKNLCNIYSLQLVIFSKIKKKHFQGLFCFINLFKELLFSIVNHIYYKQTLCN